MYTSTLLRVPSCDCVAAVLVSCSALLRSAYLINRCVHHCERVIYTQPGRRGLRRVCVNCEAWGVDGRGSVFEGGLNEAVHRLTFPRLRSPIVDQNPESRARSAWGAYTDVSSKSQFFWRDARRFPQPSFSRAGT
jgi:hypothetical protein